MHLMREKPANIDAALEMVIQHEGVEASQKHLLREKQKSESLVVQERGDSQSLTQKRSWGSKAAQGAEGASTRAH